MQLLLGRPLRLRLSSRQKQSNISHWLLLVILPVGTAGAATTAELERLVVTAQQQQRSWLSSAAAVEHRQFRQPESASDLAALLQGMPGLQADQRANLAQDSRFSIRGFGSRSSFGVRGIEVLLDDIPWSTPDGQSQPGSMLLAQLQSAEVLRGSAAALYGNAAGGVLALQSAPLPTPGVQLQHSHAADLSQQLVVLNLEQQQLSWSQARYQGFRPHNEAQKRQANWRSEFAPTFAPDLQIKLRFDWSDDPLLQDPLALTAAEWQQNPQQTNAAAHSFNSRKSSAQRQYSVQLLPDSRQWQWSLWQGQRDIEQYLAFAGDAPTSAGGVVALTRFYRGSKGQRQWQLDRWHWQFFAQLDQQRDLRRGYVNQQGIAGDLRRDEAGQVSSQEAGVRSRYQTADWGEFNAGWKWSRLDFQVRDYLINPQNPDDSGDKQLQQPSYNLGWNYLLSPELSAYISLGRGFESPTLTEMAYQRQGAGLNLALKPAINRLTDTGVKWQTEHGMLALDLFYADSEDELVVEQASNGRTTYRNAAATRRYGSELSWQYQPSAYWQQQFSLSWLQARFVANLHADNLNSRLPGVAARQASWQWQYQPFGTAHWQLSSTVNYRSKVFTDDQNRHSAPASTLLNVSSRWQWQQQQWRWQFWLAVDNLTNRQYVGAVVVNQANGRSFEPGLPRQLQAGLHWQWLVE